MNSPKKVSKFNETHVQDEYLKLEKLETLVGDSHLQAQFSDEDSEDDDWQLENNFEIFCSKLSIDLPI